MTRIDWICRTLAGTFVCGVSKLSIASFAGFLDALRCFVYVLDC